VNKLADLGRMLAERRAQITARAFAASKERLRAQLLT